MTKDLNLLSTQQISFRTDALARARTSAAKPQPSGFAKALQQAKPNTQPNTQPNSNAETQVTVGNGNTLTGIVRVQAEARGIKLSGPEEHRLAQQLASANNISNADLIHVGQRVDTTALHSELQALPASAGRPGAPAMVGEARRLVPAAESLAHRAPAATAPLAMAPKAKLQPSHPVLEQTLERAVAKGFIPAADKAPVYDKILQMAREHRFAPDDFARMTLMESDGMNPRASNQRCHGIIQFCDGPARGAASAGFANNPRGILDLSVHKQLSLVDKYFDDVGLKNQGPAGLEDLYLSVLNPASRSERQSTAALDIGGKQARMLYTDNDTEAPITRQSIRQGLLQNAAARLGQWLPASMRPPTPRSNQVAVNEQP